MLHENPHDPVEYGTTASGERDVESQRMFEEYQADHPAPRPVEPAGRPSLPRRLAAAMFRAGWISSFGRLPD